MHQNNFGISVQEKFAILASIIYRNHSIILEYSPILFLPIIPKIMMA